MSVQAGFTPSHPMRLLRAGCIVLVFAAGLSVHAAPGGFGLAANAYCNTSPPAAPAVKLTWSSSSAATSYMIYRNGTAYAGPYGSSQLTFDNTANVAAGQTYTYFIRASNSTGSTDSNTVTVSVPANVCGGGAPGAFTLSGYSYCNTSSPAAPAVQLSWTGSSGVTNYTIHRNGSAYAGPYGSSQLSFNNTANVSAGQSYTYFVRASNASGTRDSNTITVSVPANVCGSVQLPGSFTLSGYAYCNTSSPAAPAVQLSWNGSSGATSYMVYRNGTAYSGPHGSSQLSFNNTANVSAGQTFTYFIRASNGNGSTDSNTISVSVPSNVCAGAQLPGAFTLSGNAYCNTTSPVAPAVKLNWSGSNGATSYTIYRNGSSYSGPHGSSQFTFDNTANVSAGQTYTYFVRATNANGSTDSNTISVAVPSNVCAGAQVPGPFSLSATAYCNTSPPAAPAVMLTWAASANATTYTIYRNGSSYSGPHSSAQLTFDNTANVAAGQTYTYFVRATNGNGSTDSNTVTVSVPANVCTGSQSPGAFTLSGNAYCNTSPPTAPAVKLSWGASSGTTSYTIFRNGSSYSGPHASSQLTFDNTANVSAGQTYTYFVRASNASGSTDSNTITVSVPANVCSGSQLPGGFGLTASPYCNTGTAAVQLSWSSSAGATSYMVYRGGVAYAGPYGASQLTFANTANVSAGQTYTYFIRASNANGSTDSNPVTITVPANVCTGAQLPGVFTVSGNAYCNTSPPTAPAVKLTWGASSSATSYTIYRNGSSYSGPHASSQLTFDNTSNVSTGQTYTYFVRASNGNGSTDSNTITVTVPANVCAGSLAPGPFSLSGAAYCNTASPVAPAVKLTWASSSNATTYTIYRNDVSYSGPHSSAQLAFDNTSNVAAGQTYTYFVRASNGNGSTDSNTVTVTVPANVCAGSPPVAFIVSGVAYCNTNPPTAPAVKLTWNASAGTASYTVFRNGALYAGPYGPSQLTFDNTSNVAAGQTHTYFIRATNGNGSTDSNVITVAVPSNVCAGAQPPGGFNLSGSAQCATTPAVRLTWTSSTNASSYMVYRNGTAIAGPYGASQLTVDITANVSPGQTYNYFVRASNANGSADSNVVTISVPADVCASAQPPGSFTLSGNAYCNTSPPAAPAVNLNWSASANATSYTVYRNGSSYSGPHNSAQLAFDNTSTVTAGQSYTYFVRASNANGTADSNTITIGVPANVCAGAQQPGAFSLLTSVYCSTGASPAAGVKLTWTASANAIGYIVHRNGAAISGGLSASTFTLNDPGVTAGQTYTYFVRATNANGSRDSNAASVPIASNACGSGRPDLAPFGVTPARATVFAGESLNVSFEVRNTGSGAAGATTARLRLRAEDFAGAEVVVGTAATSSIAAGSSTRVDASATIPVAQAAGRYVLVVTVDDDHDLNQDSTANDRADSSVLTIARPAECAPACTTTVVSTTVANAPVAFNLAQPPSCSFNAMWTFGDGETSTAQAPNHTYTRPGMYDWSVSITANGKTCNASAGITVGSGTARTTLAGKVVHLDTGAPLMGAVVTVGGVSSTSSRSGEYSIPDLSSGTYPLTVFLGGFLRINDTIAIPAETLRLDRNFLLKPVPPPSSPVRIEAVTSKYRGQSYFLDGVPHRVTFHATVYWGTHPAGSVMFTTSRGVTKTVKVTGTTATAEFDIGADVGACGKLTATAVSTDGHQSPTFRAPVTVMTRPPFMGSAHLQIVDGGDDFEYMSSNVLLNDTFDAALEKEVDTRTIPDKFPLFKYSTFISLDPEVDVVIGNDGTVNYGSLGLGFRRERERKRAFKGSIATIDYEFTPNITVDGHFSETQCKWGPWSGQLSVGGALKGERWWPIPAAWGLIQAGGQFSVEPRVTLNVINMAPFTPVRAVDDATVKVSIRAFVSAGFRPAIYVEGGVTGEADLILYPGFDGTLSAFVDLRAVVAFGLLADWKRELGRCVYDISARQGSCSLTTSDAALTFYPRDYLESADYALFLGGGNGGVATTQLVPRTNRTGLSPIQTTVLPLSQARLSSSGEAASLIWVHDNPTRSTANRSMVVTSRWSGSNWSEPQPIADDGTADSSPRLLAFGDRSAIAAWSDQSEVISGEVSTMSDAVRRSEISAALFDPATSRWTRVERLTNNDYADRAPLLSGPSSRDAMMVWTSNPANAVVGSPSEPDQVWTSRWDGTSWSAPQRIATLPYGVHKYTFAYNGSAAHLILSLDTATDAQSNRGHELYRVSYANGQWSALERLTNDAVGDDGPEIALGNDGRFTLVWLRGEELTVANDLDVRSSAPVAVTGYSTAISDFQLASAPDGRIALTWADGSGNASSDLKVLFYDPALRAWGKPAQLTSDVEVEKYITTAFTGSSRLLAVYNRSGLRPDGTTDTAATDLYMLLHEIGGDVAIDASTLTIEPPNPAPGSTASLRAKVVNRGDRGVSNLKLSLNSGEPATGTRITTAVVEGVLPAGGNREVVVPWTVPSTGKPVALALVADPSLEVDDADRTNNIARITASRPDLSVESVKPEERIAASVPVRIRVMNRGVIPSGPTSLSIRAVKNDAILAVVPLPALQAGQSIDVVGEIPARRLNLPTPAVVVVNSGADDFDANNDRRTVTLPSAATKGRATRH